jgi:hypothetical protein
MDVTLEKETGLAVLDKREASLIELRDKFKDLKINGVEDREGYKKVSEARKTLKSERVMIVKDAKELRESAVKFQRAVIAREEELIAIIEPLEDKLHEQEKAIDAEKERLRQEEEKKETARIQTRVDALRKFNHEIDFFEAKNISDEAFNELLTQAEIDFNHEKEDKERVERERIEEENRLAEIKRKRDEEQELARQQREKELKAEAERQEKIRLEQETRQRELEAKERAIREEQAKKERELEAERQRKEQILREEQKAYEEHRRQEEGRLEEERARLAAEKRDHEEKLRREQEEKDRIAREEQIRIETEARVKREAEEKIEREKAEEIRRRALLPDEEKLAKWSQSLKEFILEERPSVTSPEAVAVMNAAKQKLIEVTEYLDLKSQKL